MEISEEQQKFINSFSWGGLLLGPFWCPLFTRVSKIHMLLAFIPIVCTIDAFYLGFNERKLSWENWQDKQDFQGFYKRHKTLDKTIVILWIVLFSLGLIWGFLEGIS